MIRIEVMNKRAVKIMRNKVIRAHKKFHIDRAEHMRKQATEHNKSLINAANQYFGVGYVPMDTLEEISAIYDNMMAEAIAEENGKCMERTH
jgi:hypothetical protein